MAGTPLSFSPTPSQTYDLLKTYTPSFLVDTALAEPDLNEDGVNELVLRHDCKGSVCRYSIFAAPDKEILPLGAVSARDIQLSDKYSGSVRSITVFNNNSNDFTGNEFAWDSETSTYQMKKAETQ